MESKKDEMANWAIAYGISIMVVKITTAVISNSLSVLSETIDVIVDFILLLILKYVIKKSQEVPDLDHTYGHGKFEGIGAIVQSTLIAVIYSLLIYSSIDVILNDSVGVSSSSITVLIFAILAAIQLLVGLRFITKARSLKSDSLKVQGINYFFDGMRSIIVIIALLLYFYAGFQLADPIFAIIISFIVIISTFASCKDCLQNLLERNPLSQEDMFKLFEVTASNLTADYIKAIKGIRVKKVGETIFITMTVGMEKEKTLEVAHEKSHDLEQLIKDAFPEYKLDILIHVQAI